MKALLVEDSAVYRKLIATSLQEWGFELTVVNDGAEAWKVLQQPSVPSLALLDWILPEVDGMELCRRIRNRSAAEPYIYILVLTAKNQKQDLLQAMAAGADDYLVKPFDEAELKARLFAGRRILELQEQLISARECLRLAATHDSLTGIWNRAEIMNFLKKELARSKREHKPLGIILADVDHFKRVNDTLGHVAGDSVLKETAKRLCSHLRVYDGAGRYGGEEFLLVLPGCDLATTCRRADEIRTLVSSIPTKSLTGDVTVTVSMGVVEVGPHSDLPFEDLLHRVDQALYLAKQKGRNRVESLSVSEGAASVLGGTDARDEVIPLEPAPAL